jgi:hypothetical protein
MSEAKGIKESMELLEGVKVLVVEVKKVMADGKVSLADLPVLMSLLQKFSVLSAAAEGAGEITKEVKDLSAEEAQTLLAKVLEVTAAAKAA